MNSILCLPRKIRDRLLTFEADWRRVLFLHFEVPADVLSRYVPLPLDLHGGKAYVSLVNFSFERLRFAGTGALGAAICRPLSEHPFLNVRTYVRGSAGPGIFFIAEWINNPLSLRLGPRSHGLPYRLGTFTADLARPGGTDHLCVEDREGHGALHVTYPSLRGTPHSRATAETRDAFLLERYRAYTHRANVTRTFEVTHEPWAISMVDWIRLDTTMLHHAFPWFEHARYAGAHTSPGVKAVVMGAPLEVTLPLHAPAVNVRESHCPAAA